MDSACALQDDVLIYSSTEEEHTAKLHEVLQKVQGSGLTEKASSCSLVKNTWIKSSEPKVCHLVSLVTAIKEVRRYSNKKELVSFLGL